MTVEVALRIKAQVGEGAIWDDQRSCLWWVDIRGQSVNALDPVIGHNQVWQCDGMPGCLALTQVGDLIIAVEHTLKDFSPQHGWRDTARSWDQDRPDNRANDGAVCRAGRFHIGTMARTRRDRAEGRLWQMDQSDGPTRYLLDGLHITNGLAFSPDNRTAYVSDSWSDVQGIWAYDYDGQTGDWSNRRLFFDTNTVPGRPDGACIDVDGCYWMAGVGGGEVLRITPKGKVDRRITLPVERPSRPAFGGANLDTLFVTSIGLDTADDALDGSILAVDPKTAGLPEPRVSWATQQ
ncbi:MAG: SMP-30/gluconolactonase/LRE family protein [Hyphomicrobiales bacterium]